jgi:hypothetical protein
MDALNDLEIRACYNLKRCKMLEIASTGSTVVTTGAVAS